MKYSIATQFSRVPSARNEGEGKYSGISLRKIIYLDGTAGYGTSFLEEVFGGLIREEKLDYSEVCKTLEIISDEEPELKEECWEYIKDAYEKS